MYQRTSPACFRAATRPRHVVELVLCFSLAEVFFEQRSCSFVFLHHSPEAVRNMGCEEPSARGVNSTGVKQTAGRERGRFPRTT